MLRAARVTGMDFGQLTKSWAAHRRYRRAVETQTKWRLVLMLTDKGWSDSAIASTIGCHVDHVSRIRRHLRGSKIK